MEACFRLQTPGGEHWVFSYILIAYILEIQEMG